MNDPSDSTLKVRPEGIPAELKALLQWVCWRLEPGKDGKLTKVPYRPDGRTKAHSTKPRTWSSFEACLAAYQEPGKRLSGIGFVFGEGDPYAGVDLDHCLDDRGELVPEAREIVERLASYTEVSPSGTGVKVWVKGSLAKGARHSTNEVEGFKKIEFYSTERYFAMTGWVPEGCPATIEARQEEFMAVHGRYFPKGRARGQRATVAGAAGSPPAVGGGFAGSDQELLDAARNAANGAKFAALYDRGDLSGYKDDHSAADIALCGLLAFWCGNDPARIERLFSASALYREKWEERPDYRQITIEKALRSCREFYMPRRRRAPEEPRPQGPRPCTDLGNAERLVDRFGEDLRHCHATGRWLRFSGKIWVPDESGVIMRRATQTARGIYGEASKAGDKSDAAALAEWAKTSESRPRLEAMAFLARSVAGIPVHVTELDADRWLLACQNGTLDLRTGELRPHRREDLITKLAPVVFDPDAAAQLWEKFLARVFAGDAELIRFVQQFLGMSLTGDISEQILVIFHGAGNNGKNVLLDTVMALMGPYAATAPPDLLTLKKQREHPTEIADLLGRRLVIASETEDGCELRLQLVKRLTGDARLKGRYMRQDFFEFDRTHKLGLVTNNLPIIRENTEAAWRRIRLVPFNVVIPEQERDPRLLEKLRAEWPGILAWLVRGCLDWRANGLLQPPAVRAATARYRGEADHIGRFLRECCTVAAGLWEASVRLRSEYDRWCKEHGERPLQGPKFTTGMMAHGLNAGKYQGKRGWHGLEVQRA